jgi:diketogulonate reductase-like aldo/keto reductase
VIPRVASRTGAKMPVLGQGTWRMGEKAGQKKKEVAALRLGFDLGMTLVDTAEMYAEGGAEEVVAEAIAGRRDEIFVVTKVLPQNASREGTIRAAERSLRRLRTDRIDLYLLHWKGRHPLAGTLEAFERLREAGKIRHYGLSNFDVEEMRRAEALAPGPGITADQVYYNLRSRGAERLRAWCVRRRMIVMAYSPLDQGRIVKRKVLRAVALRRGATPAQVALAWTLRLPGVVSIPKAGTLEHVRENVGALRLRLTAEDLADLDAEFPPPRPDEPLGML